MLYVLSIISYVQLRYTTFKVQGTKCPTKKSVDNLLPLISLPIMRATQVLLTSEIGICMKSLLQTKESTLYFHARMLYCSCSFLISMHPLK